jgi:putative redox protein
MIQVTVTSKPGVPYQHELTARGHTLVSDVAADLNGGDSGPTPHELLLMALGTCGAMTMQMVAEKAKIPLRKVTCTVTETKIADPDDATAPKIPYILEEYEVEGDNLTDAQLATLTRAAKRCPVYRVVTEKKVVDAKVTRAPVAVAAAAAASPASTAAPQGQ